MSIIMLHSLILLALAVHAQANCPAPPNFVPFGSDAGDSVVIPNDDSYELISDFHVVFFNVTYNSIYLNNNGIITFDEPFTTYTPTGLRGLLLPAVAVLWCDIDTRDRFTAACENQLSYRVSRDVAFMEAERSRLTRLGVSVPGAPTNALVATWSRVRGYGLDNTLLNTFQTVWLVTNATTVVRFAYDRLDWSVGTESDGVHATVGFSNGDSNNYAELPGSLTAAIRNVVNVSASELVFVVDTSVHACCIIGHQPPRFLAQPLNLTTISLPFGVSTVPAPEPASLPVYTECPPPAHTINVTASTELVRVGRCGARHLRHVWRHTDECGVTSTVHRDVLIAGDLACGAAICGDGICRSADGAETCLTCARDCGSCAVADECVAPPAPSPAVVGCTVPTATNYDARAGAQSTPTACAYADSPFVLDDVASAPVAVPTCDSGQLLERNVATTSLDWASLDVRSLSVGVRGTGASVRVELVAPGAATPLLLTDGSNMHCPRWSVRFTDEPTAVVAHSACASTAPTCATCAAAYFADARVRSNTRLSAERALFTTAAAASQTWRLRLCINGTASGTFVGAQIRLEQFSRFAQRLVRVAQANATTCGVASSCTLPPTLSTAGAAVAAGGMLLLEDTGALFGITSAIARADRSQQLQLQPIPILFAYQRLQLVSASASSDGSAGSAASSAAASLNATLAVNVAATLAVRWRAHDTAFEWRNASSAIDRLDQLVLTVTTAARSNVALRATANATLHAATVQLPRLVHALPALSLSTQVSGVVGATSTGAAHYSAHASVTTTHVLSASRRSGVRVALHREPTVDASAQSLSATTPTCGAAASLYATLSFNVSLWQLLGAELPVTTVHSVALANDTAMCPCTAVAPARTPLAVVHASTTSSDARLSLLLSNDSAAPHQQHTPMLRLACLDASPQCTAICPATLATPPPPTTPTSNATGVARGAVFSDPMVRTLGDCQFPFDVTGEFEILALRDGALFQLDARFERNSPADRVTFVTAFAVRGGADGDALQFQSGSAGEHFVILHNGAPLFAGEGCAALELRGVSLSRAPSARLWRLLFHDTGVVLDVEQRGSGSSAFWRLFVTVPRALIVRGARGLLTADSTCAATAPNNDAALLFRTRLDLLDRSTVFVYDDGESASSFVDDSVVPLTVPQFASLAEEQRIRQLCNQMPDDALFHRCLLDLSGARADSALERDLLQSAMNQLALLAHPPTPRVVFVERPAELLTVTFARSQTSLVLRFVAFSSAGAESFRFILLSNATSVTVANAAVFNNVIQPAALASIDVNIPLNAGLADGNEKMLTIGAALVGGNDAVAIARVRFVFELAGEAPFALQNTIWLDRNQNAVRDTGEPPLANTRVVLLHQQRTIACTRTDQSGVYRFTAREHGVESDRNYTLCVEPTAAELRPTSPLGVQQYNVGGGGQCWMGLQSQPWAFANCSAPPIALSGDAQRDFINAPSSSAPYSALHDAQFYDVGVPTALGGMVSGWDMRAVYVSYDRQADALAVAFDCFGICGDADGDGVPGSAVANMLAIEDVPDLGGSEAFLLKIDTDGDARTDLFVGVPSAPIAGCASGDIACAGVFRQLSEERLPAHRVEVLCSPHANCTDLELRVSNWSAAIVNGDAVFRAQPWRVTAEAFAGSFADAGIGEDNIARSELRFACPPRGFEVGAQGMVDVSTCSPVMMTTTTMSLPSTTTSTTTTTTTTTTISTTSVTASSSPSTTTSSITTPTSTTSTTMNPSSSTGTTSSSTTSKTSSATISTTSSATTTSQVDPGTTLTTSDSSSTTSPPPPTTATTTEIDSISVTVKPKSSATRVHSCAFTVLLLVLALIVVV
jgi:hypothetical protein